MPPIRRRTKLIADRAVRATEELLDEAGCAVNQLEENDYGFDLHVLLPTRVPEGYEDGWPMSPLSVLIQVKGGTYVDSGVRLRRDRWEYLLGSMNPVYLAAVPKKTSPWIASVEELLPRGIEQVKTGSFSAEPKRKSWAPEPFLVDALAGAMLGNTRLRRWWRQLQPDLDREPYDAGIALLTYLLDLEVLAGISGPTMSFEEFQECAERVREIVVNEHTLSEALIKIGLAHRSRVKDLELSVDLEVYVLERDFVDQSGQVTTAGIDGHNNLRAAGDAPARFLAAPAIERFLDDFDWEIEYDEHWWDS